MTNHWPAVAASRKQQVYTTPTAAVSWPSRTRCSRLEPAATSQPSYRVLVLIDLALRLIVAIYGPHRRWDALRGRRPFLALGEHLKEPISRPELAQRSASTPAAGLPSLSRRRRRQGKALCGALANVASGFWSPAVSCSAVSVPRCQPFRSLGREKFPRAGPFLRWHIPPTTWLPNPSEKTAFVLELLTPAENAWLHGRRTH